MGFSHDLLDVVDAVRSRRHAWDPDVLWPIWVTIEELRGTGV